MFGWRARIGFISPGTSAIHTSALEMEMAAPEGVLLVSKFLNGPKSVSPEHCREMFPQIDPAARALVSKSEIDVMVMGGAPLCLAIGPEKVKEALESATGLPSTTNVEGIVNGLRRLGLQRITVLTPYYKEDMAALVREYLEGAGIEIVALSTGAVEFGTHKDRPQEMNYRLAKKAFLDGPPSDGLVIVGGGTPLHKVIETLETDIGKPVVANNFASLWGALTLANVRTPITGYGKLLTCF